MSQTVNVYNWSQWHTGVYRSENLFHNVNACLSSYFTLFWQWFPTLVCSYLSYLQMFTAIITEYTNVNNRSSNPVHACTCLASYLQLEQDPGWTEGRCSRSMLWTGAWVYIEGICQNDRHCIFSVQRTSSAICITHWLTRVTGRLKVNFLNRIEPVYAR